MMQTPRNQSTLLWKPTGLLRSAERICFPSTWSLNRRRASSNVALCPAFPSLPRTKPLRSASRWPDWEVKEIKNYLKSLFFTNMPPGYCIIVLYHAYDLEQTKSVTLVLERTRDLNLSSNKNEGRNTKIGKCWLCVNCISYNADCIY